MKRAGCWPRPIVYSFTYEVLDASFLPPDIITGHIRFSWSHIVIFKQWRVQVKNAAQFSDGLVVLIDAEIDPAIGPFVHNQDRC